MRMGNCILLLLSAFAELRNIWEHVTRLQSFDGAFFSLIHL